MPMPAGSRPTGATPEYHLVYTRDWRMVVVYRGSDASLKERHTPHMAGFDGVGNVTGGGGPDGEIMRDKDASTAWSAAANALDERRYICQNQRGDVVAVLTDNGILVEQVRYSAYGMPTGLPGGDTDSDGDWDATDRKPGVNMLWRQRERTEVPERSAPRAIGTFVFGKFAGCSAALDNLHENQPATRTRQTPRRSSMPMTPLL